MWTALRRLGSRAAVTGPTLGIALGLALGLVGVPAAAAEASVTFNGKGYGHGRGMGQWGAYGYAVDKGWSWTQITNHYYGGSTLAQDAGNPSITTRIEASVGRPTYVRGSSMTVWYGSSSMVVGTGAVLITRVGPNRFTVAGGPGCGGPWTQYLDVAASKVTVTTATPPASYGALLGRCEDNQVRAYRGSLSAVETGSGQATVNTAPVDEYLRGVVPRESSPSWATAGGGKGAEALKAQALAARSYALSEGRYPYAGTCDTTSCQVYGGAATLSWAGVVANVLEDPRTDAAIAATAGYVRRMPSGQVARTEFSSSTGGWTAGGTFTAVPDEGDATAANPNKTWSVSLPLSTISAKLGVGTVTGLAVTARNGLGADGGRALTVAVATTGGTVSLTGDQVRSRLGLKSTWYSVAGYSLASSRSFVTALYVDLLGRAPDSAGLAYWSGLLSAGTVSQASLANQVAFSDEYLFKRVNGVYQDALRRAAEPGGLAYWAARVRSGASFSDITGAIFGSQESVQVLGGGSRVVWVSQLYPLLLGRASDSGAAYWSNAAATLGTSWVAAEFARSDEARRLRVSQYYLMLLGRAPDAGGLAYYAPFLLGNGDFTVPATLASSPEYFTTAGARFPGV